MQSKLGISVVVPTYKRPEELLRCLEGLDRQQRPPLEVIVVRREEDERTRRAVESWMARPARYAKRSVVVRTPGVVEAMRAGTAAAAGEIAAYIDDDAVPRPAWLAVMADRFADPAVGGVGGRDVIGGAAAPKPGVAVGRVTWYGKLIGNHDAGAGDAREADVLKGVNMAFRKELVRFPQGLKGQGAQVHFEVHVCLRIRRLGYKLIYDPGLSVDHYPAVRHDADQRDRLVPEAVRHAAYNLQLGILTWGGRRRLWRIIYSAFVGDRSAPGVVRWLLGVVRGETAVIRSFLPAQAGAWRGLLDYLNRRHIAGDR